MIEIKDEPLEQSATPDLFDGDEDDDEFSVNQDASDPDHKDMEDAIDQISLHGFSGCGPSPNGR